MISPPPLASIVVRVKELVTTSLSKKKKNHIKGVTEIENLLKYCERKDFENLISSDSEFQSNKREMSGSTAMNSNRVPFISTLLDDLDFSDPRTISNKDDQKVNQ